MNTTRYLSLFAFCALRALASPDVEGLPRQPALVAIQIVATDFGGAEKQPRGWFYFAEQQPNGVAGPFLTGYQVRDGKVIGSLLTGSSSREWIRQIENVGLEPFDWDTELEKARDECRRRSSESWTEPIALHGAELEISVSTRRGSFRMRAWNPTLLIDYYAPFSPRIAKLKRVLDLVATYQGRKQIGI